MAMRTGLCGLCCAGALVLAGCGSDSSGSNDDGIGTMSAALAAVSPHDVGSVRYVVVPATGTCADTPLVEVIVPMETESLTTTVQPVGAGAEHLFADALFTLPPGDYLVCAFPLTATGDPSAECRATEAVGTVSSGVTSEILLVSQCDGVDNGALDAITVLNDPPVIEAVTLDPSKFVGTCENAVLTAMAADPNGDEITYVWAIITGSASLVPSGNTAVFTATTAGDYEVMVTAIDIYGGVTSLIVPVHVTGEPCGMEFCHAIGYDACPTGATEWCTNEPIDPASSAQAQDACETCYGAPCYLENADCAGLGWGPRPAGEYVCGEAYFGFENGCSGDDGRVWAICSSFTTYGYWGKP